MRLRSQKAYCRGTPACPLMTALATTSLCASASALLTLSVTMTAVAQALRFATLMLPKRYLASMSRSGSVSEIAIGTECVTATGSELECRFETAMHMRHTQVRRTHPLQRHLLYHPLHRHQQRLRRTSQTQQRYCSRTTRHRRATKKNKLDMCIPLPLHRRSPHRPRLLHRKDSHSRLPHPLHSQLTLGSLHCIPLLQPPRPERLRVPCRHRRVCNQRTPQRCRPQPESRRHHPGCTAMPCRRAALPIRRWHRRRLTRRRSCSRRRPQRRWRAESRLRRWRSQRRQSRMRRSPSLGARLRRRRPLLASHLRRRQM